MYSSKGSVFKQYFIATSRGNEEKRKMLLGLERVHICKEIEKRIILSDNDIRAGRISDFVTKNTVNFFETLSMKTNFMKKKKTQTYGTLIYHT